MTAQEKDKIMNLLTRFINENLWQQIKPLAGESFLTLMNQEMTGMVRQPNTAEK